MSHPVRVFAGNAPMVLGIGWMEVAIGMVLLVLRVYGFIVGAGTLRWDFFWSVMAMMFALIGMSFYTLCCINGAGNHLANLDLDHIKAIARWFFIYSPFCLAASCCAKFAVIALLMQIQGPTAKKRNWFLWGVGATIAIFSFLAIMLAITACDTVEQSWNILANGHCPRKHLTQDFVYAQGGVAIFTDVVLSLWPITIAWNLQTSLRVKVGFCTLMALGILPTVAVAMRTVKVPHLLKSTDPMYELGPVLIWLNTEQWAIIILTSIPPLRPLFRRMFNSITSTMGATNPSQGAQSKGTGIMSRSVMSPPADKIAFTQEDIKGGIQRTTKIEMNAEDFDEDRPSPTLPRSRDMV